MNKIPPFVLIGLPGVGKSTVADAVIFGTDTKVISTDKHFAAVRSDIKHPITKNFIEQLSAERGEKIDSSLLPSSAAFTEKYGMKAFRDLEEMILTDLINQTDFNGKILDLGGAAFGRENTRNAIRAKGITSIYLKSEPELIAANLYKDFLEIKASGQIRRGNYFKAALDAENNGKDAQQALFNLSRRHLLERDAYYSLADYTLKITQENSLVSQTAERIKIILETNQNFNQKAHNTTFRPQILNETASR